MNAEEKIKEITGEEPIGATTEEKTEVITFINAKTKRIIIIALYVILGIISFIFIADLIPKMGFVKSTVKSLEDKQTQVFSITATSTLISSLLTLIPGNVGAAVANQITNLANYLLIVLTALSLEKLFMLMLGTVVCKVLIPLGCIFGIISLVFESVQFKKIAFKIMAFALVLLVVVPIGIKTSDYIYNKYCAEDINNKTQSISGNINDIKEKQGSNKNEGLFNVLGKIGDTIDNAIKYIQETAKMIVSNMLDIIATFIVCTCILPIGIVFFIIWMIKIIFNFSITLDVKKIKEKKIIRPINLKKQS